PGGDLNSSRTFEVLSGEEYQIAVDGVNGAAGNIVMNVSLKPRPLNDNFTNRIPISDSLATVNGSNSLATFEAQEPLHCGHLGGRSVWWSWTPAVSRVATITTAGSDFNTLLAVYTGNDLSRLEEVASNDDDPAGGSLQSCVSFAAVA